MKVNAPDFLPWPGSWMRLHRPMTTCGTSPLLTPFRRLLATCGVVERQRMAAVLGGFASPLSVALLRFMLHDAEGRVRSAAVQSLADLAQPHTVAVLIEALADSNSDVRWIATRALGDLTGADVVGALIPMLTDEDNEVGRIAAEGLGRQADRRAVPHLIAAPARKLPDVTRERRRGPRPVGRRARPIRPSWSTGRRQSAGAPQCRARAQASRHLLNLLPQPQARMNKLSPNAKT